MVVQIVNDVDVIRIRGQGLEGRFFRVAHKADKVQFAHVGIVLNFSGQFWWQGTKVNFGGQGIKRLVEERQDHAHLFPLFGGQDPTIACLIF